MITRDVCITFYACDNIADIADSFVCQTARFALPDMYDGPIRHLGDISTTFHRVTAFGCEYDGIGLEDENRVAEVARHLPVRFEQSPAGEVLVYYRDVDASRAIRTEEGGRGASTAP